MDSPRQMGHVADTAPIMTRAFGGAAVTDTWGRTVVLSTGRLVSITIVNARWLLEQDEQVTVTLPTPMRLDRHALAAAIGAG